MRSLALALLLAIVPQAGRPAGGPLVLTLQSRALASPLKLDGFYLETAQGKIELPPQLVQGPVTLADGRVVTLRVTRESKNFSVHFTAKPDSGIIRWGLSVEALNDEHYTGLMERVVDGPQQASWAPGIKRGMDLRGQKVDMIVKPTTSVYAPFYLSSRGYAVFVKGTWPGHFDFAAANAERVQIDFEGPALEMKVYMDEQLDSLVRQHALDAGPPFLPPKWVFTPWRWRDEHSQLSEYYDGTRVTGPFNSQVMEDLLMMKAYDIPTGVYWVDRPWGPGRLGYDDFEIDKQRLPNFPEMVTWLNEHQVRMMLWIAPFFQGTMEREALAKGFTLAGQPPQPNNYPMVDLTNPAAKAYWQEGVAKLLKLGVAAFKLDRGEENIPESGPYTVFDGRSIRENRNAYPAMYVKATYDVARKYRGNDFVLMPRGAYSGSSSYGAFWGGDVAGTQEGLRASIIAVQRSALMGYPIWGSDTCGYGESPMEQEVCGRWLAFSCFTPIMEVGPTRNVGFWNLPRTPSYDAELIAIWRLYARLHQRIADYSYAQAKIAQQTGMPVIRPLVLLKPKALEAWSNWQTYLYGPDLLVSPIWEKGSREQHVYLPKGDDWRDAWNPGRVYHGGQTIIVHAELHQIPLFIRSGSKIKLGDLNHEFTESISIAQKMPDLRALDAEVKLWFERLKQTK